ECVRKLKPYSCARDEYHGDAGIFLDANENSLGSVLNVDLNRYPDPRQTELKARIAAIKNVSMEQLFLGNGSDEVIDLLVRVFCEPGRDKVMILPPTYGMYKVVADINNVAVVEVPLTQDYQIDIDTVLENADNVKLIFICSPNNPTGNVINETEILALIEKFSGLIVIDEAYIDFVVDKSWLPRLKQYPNLVILQTFSKAWGLASIRLGMGFADPLLIDLLNKIKYPYNVSGATQQLALEALSYLEKKDKMVARILSERQKLIGDLKKLDIVQKVYSTDANFILIRFRDAKQVFDYLIQKQIIVRDRSNVIRCDDSLRITVGKPEENNILIEALENFTAESALRTQRDNK
ncbi:MAG: histidinol-phosphate transaminase, partial [Candidatus Marinimicrobia bacterium]|nr:histidinol-phosphate transaminase [Candidatus Neomarinimicrobiota bacterium]